MHLSPKEVWTALHGMGLGAGFLLLFSGGFFALRNLDADLLSEAGLKLHIRRLSYLGWTMTTLAWLTVLVGTYWSYPWYRAAAPKGVTSAALVAYPKSFLLSNPNTAQWHEFGMEWKEHIAWLTPILLTAVAFLISNHGRLLASNAQLRRVALTMFTVAFFCAGVAGVLGALINKAAPVR